MDKSNCSPSAVSLFFIVELLQEIASNFSNIRHSTTITLSTDGGQTFPFTLAANTPNDSTQSIIVPNGNVTTQARIKVQGSGNIFFDINNANFKITLAPIAAPASIVGRVLTENGRGISRASVKLTNAASGESFDVITNPFGYFRFENLPIGDLYIVTVKSKSYEFTNSTQTFNLTDVTFIGSRR